MGMGMGAGFGMMMPGMIQQSMAGGQTARDLMRVDRTAVGEETTLEVAAQVMAAGDVRSVPVVDGDERVLGMLSERDFLDWVGVGSVAELLLKTLEDHASVCNACRRTRVKEVMTTDVEDNPPVVNQRRHGGRVQRVDRRRCMRRGCGRLVSACCALVIKLVNTCISWLASADISGKCSSSATSTSTESACRP